MNVTEETQHVAVTLSEHEGETVLSESYEIGERKPTGEATVIREDEFVEARTDDRFTIDLELSSGESAESGFRVMCMGRENSTDVFVAEIRASREENDTYFVFDQSVCG
ncbi:hypothetical protein C483_04044 [Natrialba hulunbeirensis JCM 10989]|uniref:Uncharacterized protein n=1 Tax=Natrialba hulunbeirensis JCM 10989 TaxID=1227493 RepID=M0A901_9EURY|nr:hypothetical protein [Natrialba hulunbeirensis]ELY93818.1 hypothetical protein C483_04044 [Natrialba hulunbeirensis JCM 10989]